ncbi:hypothetical protein KIPB_007504 [Kipferlia bialata]|uniref:Uncharacterized protein n=1 Tax=Kipferlia bialata TaxID=797122 RepID=A0A391NN00_9EUKA|nr:hypothetical protein KIPB_007504 [Kipferlia bialata]|eukprot:g7504.t1
METGAVVAVPVGDNQEPVVNSTGPPPPFVSSPLLAVLGTVLALGLPLALSAINDRVGALVPMIIYYALALGLYRVSHGSLRASLPPVFPHRVFWPLMTVQCIGQVVAYFHSPPATEYTDTYSLPGFLFTLLVWCPVNAFCEQYLWLWIYDSVACLPTKSTGRRRLYNVLGGVCLVVYIGAVHALYWGDFCFLPDQGIHPSPRVDSAVLTGAFFVMLTIIAIGYIPLRTASQGHMLPLFLLHLPADVAPTLFLRYSMAPALFK